MAKRLLEFDYLITADGVTYNLQDGYSRFLTTAINPLGLPGIDIETQRAPGQHGETALTYALKPRTLTMVHRRRGKNRYEYWQLRRDIINHLRPNRQPVWGAYEPCQLIRELPNGERWALDVYWAGGMEFRESANWDEHSAQDVIRFNVYDPTFYDPDVGSVTLSIVVAGAELAFPIAFPIIFQAEDTIDDFSTITYLGDWESFPVIEIDGPVTGIIITNSDTGERLELQYAIPLGDTVTIDCNSSEKTVTDLSGTNLIGVLSDDSDLGTFHLAPDPESPGGINTIHVYGIDAAAGITEVRFGHHTRRIGL